MNSEIKKGDKIYFFLDKLHDNEQHRCHYSYNNIPNWEIQEREVQERCSPYDPKRKTLYFDRVSTGNSETLNEYRDDKGNFRLRYFNNILVDIFKCYNLYVSKDLEKLKKVLEKRKKFDMEYIKKEKAMNVAKISLDESELIGKFLTSKRSNRGLQKYYYVESITKDNVVKYRDFQTHNGSDLIIGRSFSSTFECFLSKCKDDNILSIEDTNFYDLLKF